MSHITLHYVLSQKAQRAELAAGRPAHRDRQFQLEPTDELAQASNIDAKGNATIDRTFKHEADHVLVDQADAVAFIAACDAAVKAKQREIQASEEESARVRAERAAERAAEEAAQKERQAREQEERLRLETEVQDWAREYGFTPELRRAAGERRDVIGEVRRMAKERVITAVTEVVEGYGFVVTSYLSEPREGVPNREAYALLDALRRSALLGIANASGLPDAKAEISDIVRHDVAPRGDEVWRTGVTVTVSHPWLANAIEVDVISEPLPEEEESEEC